MNHLIKDCSLLKEEQRRNSKQRQQLASIAFKKAMKATWGETSDEESEVEDGDNDNLSLMAKSDTDSDNDSSEGLWEHTWHHGELCQVWFFTVVASSGSSMETAPTSLSPEEGSDGSPSHSSPKAIELSSLLTDIRIHYTAREPDSPTLPKTISSPADSTSLCPNIGARKRSRRSTGVPTFGSNFPCVSGASSTRAGRSEAVGPSTVPNSFVPKTRSQIKPFSARKLLKGKMGCITRKVGQVLVVFNSQNLASMLGITDTGFAACQKNKWPDLPPPLKPLEIVQKFLDDPSRTSISKFFKRSMYLYHRYLFSFFIRNLIPRQERRDAASFLDLSLMELLDQELSINFLKLIVSYLTKVVTDVHQNHAMPYGFLLTKLLGQLGVQFTSVESYSLYDTLDYFETRGSHTDEHKSIPTDGTRTSQSPEVGEVELLRLENARLRLEIEQLKAQLVKNEETVVARHNDLMSLIRSLSSLPVPSLSTVAPSPPYVP
ncbi:hypothetical protein HAX54_033470 [Datura stramonium]|uniref:Uncharacterized protein n=1 Tax=Datura stramonium TaxID=4076 RepID=A0ABS8VCL4_DATST|nr:hypothetical protein [Datura stramonium]